jgi:hypothetical protein
LHIYDRNEIEQLRSLPGVNLRHLVAKSIKEFGSDSEGEDEEEEIVEGFKFSENIVDKKTMFANDITNVAVVSFENAQEVNIDDL